MFTSEQDPCSKGIETLGRVVVGNNVCRRGGKATGRTV